MKQKKEDSIHKMSYSIQCPYYPTKEGQDISSHIIYRSNKQNNLKNIHLAPHTFYLEGFQLYFQNNQLTTHKIEYDYQHSSLSSIKIHIGKWEDQQMYDVAKGIQVRTFL